LPDVRETVEVEDVDAEREAFPARPFWRRIGGGDCGRADAAGAVVWVCEHEGSPGEHHRTDDFGIGGAGANASGNDWHLVEHPDEFRLSVASVPEGRRVR
jgi:hypothetical protein